MIFAAVSLVVLLLPSVLALAVSARIDRDGHPAGWSGWTTRRKPGTFPARIPLILLNQAILAVSSALGLYAISEHFPLGLPNPLLVALHFVLLVLVDDIIFYWVHRVLHTNKTLYRLIHKKHHEAFAPVPSEYLYVHPLEWMIGSAGPVVGVALVLGLWGEMSAWTFWLWGAFRTLHELDIHSGVRSTWARHIPFYGVMEHHDRHHAKPTLGNYASTLTIWDKVFKTEIPTAEPRSPA